MNFSPTISKRSAFVSGLAFVAVWLINPSLTRAQNSATGALQGGIEQSTTLPGQGANGHLMQRPSDNPMQGQVQQQQNANPQMWQQQPQMAAPPVMAPLQSNVQQSQFNAGYQVLQGQAANQMLQGQAGNQMLQGQAGNGAPVQLGIQGGEEAFGCLGCVINPMGFVQKIFPESDLNQYGIAPGDQVVGIFGHPFDNSVFQRECVGAPGTIIPLVILHFGRPMQIAAHRIDSRELARHAKYYKEWANKTRYW